MRTVISIFMMACLASCSLSPSAQEPGQSHSARRAHSGKYIVERSHLAGSRSLFVTPSGNQCLNSSRAVSEYLSQHYRERNRDAAFIIYLNDMNDVIHMREMTVDRLGSPSQYIPIVTQDVEERSAASVIFVQCSPTRASKPFKKDHEISNQLESALTAMGVGFLDHLIMGRNECFSFADNQLL